MAERLAALLKDGRLSNLFFVRHGKTAPAPGPGRDKERELNDEGLRQCEMAHQSETYRSIGRSAGWIITSSAGRCQETARHAFGEELLWKAQVVVAKSIYPGDNSEWGEEAFNRISYAPLDIYLAEEHGEEELVAKYASNVLQEVSDIVKDGYEAPPPLPKINSPEGASQVAPAASVVDEEEEGGVIIVGHAVYTQACVVALTKALGLSDQLQGIVRQVVIGEVSGFNVTKDKVDYITP